MLDFGRIVQIIDLKKETNMTRGDFTTPGRQEVSDEFDDVAASLEHQGNYLNFDIFMNQANQWGVPGGEAARVLSQCGGDYQHAFSTLREANLDIDPSVHAWGQAVGATALSDMIKHQT